MAGDLLTYCPEFSYVTTPPVKVVVGREEACTLFIHRGLLTPRAGYFTRALETQCDKSDILTVKLKEDDPYIFQLYAMLLYARESEYWNILCGGKGIDPWNVPEVREDGDRVASRPDEDIEDTSCSELSDEDLGAKTFFALCKLFVLAEKLEDFSTQEIVLVAMSTVADDIYSSGTESPDFGTITMIYKGTPEDSPARAAICKIFGSYVCHSFPKDVSVPLPDEFLRDLADSLIVNHPHKEDVEELHGEVKKKDTKIDEIVEKTDLKILEPNVHVETDEEAREFDTDSDMDEMEREVDVMPSLEDELLELVGSDGSPERRFVRELLRQHGWP